MNATTNTTIPATATELLAQAGNIGADLVASTPTVEVPAEAGKTVKEVIAETATSGIETAKAATDKAMGFVAEHKTSFLVGAGVAAAAGVGYGLYKWHKKRQDAKANQAKADQAKEDQAKAKEAKTEQAKAEEAKE